jgi:chromate reductase
MKNILLFAGSNSSASINKKLICYTASLVENHKTEFILLEDYEPPVFSLDLEKKIGSHARIKDLVEKLDAADAIIISTPEHNSMPPAFFKNILDWLSRTAKQYREGKQYLEEKPILLMSAAPGNGGGAKARALVAKMIGYAKGEIISEFTLPKFNDNFHEGKIVHEELDQELKAALQKLLGAIQN